MVHLVCDLLGFQLFLFVYANQTRSWATLMIGVGLDSLQLFVAVSIILCKCLSSAHLKQVGIGLCRRIVKRFSRSTLSSFFFFFFVLQPASCAAENSVMLLI